jgi:hypothetical protein
MKYVIRNLMCVFQIVVYFNLNFKYCHQQCVILTTNNALK